MQITLKTTQNIYTVFSKFTEQTLPLKLSYKIMKLLRALDEELNFYREQLQSLIKDCAELDENGQFKYIDNGESILIKEDKITEFHERNDELSNMEIELSDDFVFTLDELENLELTPKDLAQIDVLIQE